MVKVPHAHYQIMNTAVLVVSHLLCKENRRLFTWELNWMEIKADLFDTPRLIKRPVALCLCRDTGAQEDNSM
jgi:hypothetical protein